MGFESWGIVEIMGHKVYAGKLSEQEVANTAMLRVDVPETGGIPEYTKLFGAAAIYAITPTDEAGARAAATRLRERPISPYVLPALAAVSESVEFGAVYGHHFVEDDDRDIESDDQDDQDDEDVYWKDFDTTVAGDTARDRAANWAYAVLNNFNNLRVLDCETTGIASGSEPVSIAVIDKAGSVLLDTLVKPSKPIPADASRIHGITDEMVADAPTFAEVWPKLIAAIGESDEHDSPKYPVVVYNVDFDRRVLREAAAQIDERLPLYNFQCAMENYAEFYGGANGKWQKLVNACAQQGIDGIEDQAHSAVGDCQRTLALVRKMAEQSRRHTAAEVSK